MDFIVLVITSVLILLLLMNTINILSFRKISPVKKISQNIFLSILIPARDEEDNIDTCIESILNQSYKNYELIILNDNSTDKTMEIINSFNDSRLKIINGKSLQKGWIGKNYACHQLQKLAKGEYLLFIDADTVMSKDCILSSLNFALENNTDLLTLMPYEKSVTFWEKVVIPMLYFGVMIFLPILMVERSKIKQLAMGNGQFMLFKKNFYRKIGGHESLKNNIVEDVWLAKRVKEFKGKLIFADGTNIIKCRMYKTLDEIWNGFSKNVFAGLSFSLIGLAGIISIYFIFFISPLFFLYYGLILSNTFILKLSLVSIFIPILIRITHSIKFKQSFALSFLNILSSIFIILVSLNSYRVLKYGKGAIWKGREYKESIINFNP